MKNRGYRLLFLDLKSVADKNRCWHLVRDSTTSDGLLVSLGKLPTNFSKVARWIQRKHLRGCNREHKIHLSHCGYTDLVWTCQTPSFESSSAIHHGGVGVCRHQTSCSLMHASTS